MEWKPKRWIAVLLSVFSSSLGLLYLGKARWAIGLGVFSLACVLAAVVAPPLFFLTYVLAAVTLALPILIFFKSRSVVLPARPWYSRPTGMALIACAVVGAILGVRIFLYEPFKVPSGAMEPTLPRGSMVLVQKAGFGHFSTFGMTLGRGGSVMALHADVIAFEYPLDPAITYVQRVVGLPGDIVKVEGAQVTVNGKVSVNRRLDDSGTMEEGLGAVRYSVRVQGQGFPYWQANEFPGRERCRFTRRSVECTVPDGHYFVLGDNRNNSADSRIWGFVPVSNVIGKVVQVFTPI